MRAIVINQEDSMPEHVDKKMPELQEGQVMLNIRASSMNHRDVWITKGLYPGIVSGATMGSDGCGTWQGEDYVINPGLDWGLNQNFQDSRFRVLGVPDDGTFADYIAIDKKYLYLKPSHLTVTQAAALPLAGVTAYRALFSRAGLRQGEKVLVTGIGGGVALMAFQFALALGCTVVVTSGDAAKITKAMKMGAVGGYDYKDTNWTKDLVTDFGGVDVVIDGACGPGFSGLIRVCQPGGRIAFYGATAGQIGSVNPQQVFWKQLSILGSTMGSESDFGQMIDFVSKHHIVPVIDCVLPLDNYRDGFSRMAEGKQFGKIVFSH